MTRRATTAELAEKLDQIEHILSQRDGNVELQIAKLTDKLERLEKLVEKGFGKEAKAESCPYRVEIAKATNNHHVIQELCDEVTKLRIEMARLGLAGGILGLVTAAGVVIGKVVGVL